MNTATAASAATLTPRGPADVDREKINIVIVGHVDHGKSTVIGRLLADTGSLPEGKLEDVKALCARNAKPFEYAFLLDALKDERNQGITIDSARCFFKTALRDYIVIDAPGHIEFLKNMVTGAARAEAALLVICASEGIRENSKRHGYLVSMLGIRQVVVLVNKMDLVGYDRATYDTLVADYTAFLHTLGVEPLSFIPVSAMEGDNLAAPSGRMPWYQGPTVLEQLDRFEAQEGKRSLPLRFPVQDIYKFTEEGDERRILAGTIETGAIGTGDEVVFFPSGKTSRVRSIEAFNVPSKAAAEAGEAIGVTLETQIYIKPGEIMTKPGERPPRTHSRFKAHVFWMGRSPLIKGKTYKLKLSTARSPVRVADILQVLDATDLSMTHRKQQLDRHDVGEIILETPKPIAFDPAERIEGTGRFVLVDHYEIAGGGIVQQEVEDGTTLLKEHVRGREIAWDRGMIAQVDRRARNRHASKFIVFTGEEQSDVAEFARKLEETLFRDHHQTYYLGLNNMLSGMGSGIQEKISDPSDSIRLLGELARILTDSGLIFITALPGIDDDDLETLSLLNFPAEIVVVAVGSNGFSRYPLDFVIPSGTRFEDGISSVYNLLREKEIVIEYTI